MGGLLGSIHLSEPPDFVPQSGLAQPVGVAVQFSFGAGVEVPEVGPEVDGDEVLPDFL